MIPSPLRNNSQGVLRKVLPLTIAVVQLSYKIYRAAATCECWNYVPTCVNGTADKKKKDLVKTLSADSPCYDVPMQLIHFSENIIGTGLCFLLT